MMFAQKFQCYNKDHRDYNLCRFRWLIHRGPPVPKGASYICCVGNASTFGRFVKSPYPLLLSKKLGVPVWNLGFGRLAPESVLSCNLLMEIINNSQCVVLQFRQHFDLSVLTQTLHVPYIDLKISFFTYPKQHDHSKIASLLFSEIESGNFKNSRIVY